MSCTYELRCQNNDKCYRCFNEKLLKLKEDKNKKKYSGKGSKKILASKEDSWKDLEQEVATKLNSVPTMQEARRSRRSGALWFEQGDVVDDILHPECKERTGRELKSGTKSLTIQKEWLDKAKEECVYSNKVMTLPFRFKGDDVIYNIMEFDDIISLVTTIKAYYADNKAKENEIIYLNEKIKQLQENCPPK